MAYLKLVARCGDFLDGQLRLHRFAEGRRRFRGRGPQLRHELAHFFGEAVQLRNRAEQNLEAHKQCTHCNIGYSIVNR